MSDAIAVAHGPFGRVCLYAVDRVMAPHAHREGHLIFHVGGPPAELVIDGRAWPFAPGQAVAVSPWQTHFYRPIYAGVPVMNLVLYIRPAWFLEAARCATASLRFGRAGIEVTDHLRRIVLETARAMSLPEPEDGAIEERLCTLTQAAFDQSWQWTSRGAAFTGPDPAHGFARHDFRIRKALKLFREDLAQLPDLDAVAREVGLSRPHFYKLFREQVGVTPNIYLNALRMEQAIGALVGSDAPVADIGFDLGFSSQASFSRFFISNGVVAPSAYRRSVQVAAGF
jgi:AraC-like DNA-binding protein